MTLGVRIWPIFALGLAGCAGPLDAGVGAFRAGRLPQAAAEFRAVRPHLAELSAPERVRFALFYGLTELALGDAVQADRWLSAVQRVVRERPALLARSELGALEAALRSLGHMPGDG